MGNKERYRSAVYCQFLAAFHISYRSPEMASLIAEAVLRLQRAHKGYPGDAAVECGEGVEAIELLQAPRHGRLRSGTEQG